jgi:hypothetical protein
MLSVGNLVLNTKSSPNKAPTLIPPCFILFITPEIMLHIDLSTYIPPYHRKQIP